MLENRLEFYKTTFWILFSFLSLLGVGFSVQYSASKGSFCPLMCHQFFLVLAFIPFLLFFSFVNEDFYQKFSYIIFFICVVLLIMVNFVGTHAMGATRWIKIFGFKFQPSEMTKIAVILLVSKFYSQINYNSINNFFSIFFIISLVSIPILLILNQPNLGTSIVICFIVINMLFITGISIKFFIFSAVICICSIPFIWNYLLYDYQKVRIFTFLGVGVDSLSTGYNVLQSMIAIGSGGLFGKGFLSGSQAQLEFLPEKHTDFAFVVFAEEFGFLGAILVFVLYFILFVQIVKIINRSSSTFFKIMTTGILAMFGIHFFINIGMVIGVLPIVGVPILFISYGGSVLLTSMISIGMIISANRHSWSAMQQQ